MEDEQIVKTSGLNCPEDVVELRRAIKLARADEKNKKFETMFEDAKCSERECENHADAFIIVKLDTKLIRTALCRNHLLDFIEGWVPSIKAKHQREGIENLKLARSPRAKAGGFTRSPARKSHEPAPKEVPSSAEDSAGLKV